MVQRRPQTRNNIIKNIILFYFYFTPKKKRDDTYAKNKKIKTQLDKPTMHTKRMDRTTRLQEHN